LSSALNVDPGQQSIRLSGLAGDTSLPDGSEAAQLQSQILDKLKKIPDIGYGVAYQNLLSAANEQLNRPLKDGFRMKGSSAVPSWTASSFWPKASASRSASAEILNPLWNVGHVRDLQARRGRLMHACQSGCDDRTDRFLSRLRHPRSRGLRARWFGRR